MQVFFYEYFYRNSANKSFVYVYFRWDYWKTQLYTASLDQSLL